MTRPTGADDFPQEPERASVFDWLLALLIWVSAAATIAGLILLMVSR